MPQQQQQHLEGNNNNNNNNRMGPGSSGRCSVRDTQDAVAKFVKLLQMRHQHQHHPTLRNAKCPMDTPTTTTTTTKKKKKSIDGSREVCTAHMMLALQQGAASPHDIQTTCDKVALMLGGTDDARVEGIHLFFVSCLAHATKQTRMRIHHDHTSHHHHDQIMNNTQPLLAHTSLGPPLQADSTTTTTKTTTLIGPSTLQEKTRKGADFFVAVHVGAGFHSVANADAYSTAMSDACMAAASVLKKKGGGSALDAVEAAIRILEDSWVTNAGVGSNLTENGCVENDASVMDGHMRTFGAVGAVPGVKNAVSVAARLAKESQLGLLPLGRIRPIFLVGNGAHDWALSRGLDLMPPNKMAPHGLVTEKAHRQWMRYSEMVAKASASNGGKEEEEEEEEAAGAAAPWDRQHQHDVGTTIIHPTTAAAAAATNAQGPPTTAATPPPPATAFLEGAKEEEEEVNDEVRLDTVGAVCVDAFGHVASGVSSGGIAMKVRGRVGEAAVYGCGCWAANADVDGQQQPAVASSATGVGESIIRATLARDCCHAAHTAEDGPGRACERIVSELVKRMQEEGEYAGAAAPSPHGRRLLPPTEAGILLLTAHSSSSNTKRTTTSCPCIPQPPPPPPPPPPQQQQQQQQQEQQGFAGLSIPEDETIPSATTVGAAARTPPPPPPPPLPLPRPLGAAMSPSAVGPHGGSSLPPLLVPGGSSSTQELEEGQPQQHHHQQQQQQQSHGPIILIKAQSQYEHNNNNNNNSSSRNEEKERDGRRSRWARRGGQEEAAAACTKEEQQQQLERVELVAVHSAPSFGVGYMASTMAHPHTLILRSQNNLQGEAAVNTFAVLHRF